MPTVGADFSLGESVLFNLVSNLGTNTKVKMRVPQRIGITNKRFKIEDVIYFV
jgi:hypothetical protein